MICGDVLLRWCRPARRGVIGNAGHLPADDRSALQAIIYVLRKNVSRRGVPAEQAGCRGVTAWRRLRDWTEAGIRPRPHEVLLDDAAIDGPT